MVGSFILFYLTYVCYCDIIKVRLREKRSETMERKELIMNEYKMKGYNTAQVARILGISRRGMYNFLDGKMPYYKAKRYEELIYNLKPLHDTEYTNLVERATQLDNVISKDIMKMTPTELSVFNAYNIIKQALDWSDE